jgi:hypothetical protein
LKAIPPPRLTAEPLDAIAEMAERLADRASGRISADAGAHLEVVEQFGIHMLSFERGGQMRVCYDGELFRRVLTLAGARSDERARAVLGLTRPDCIDPALSPLLRASLDEQRGELLDGIDERDLDETTKSRLHARRAAVWASIAYAQARRGEQPQAASKRALLELLAVHANEFRDDAKAEYLDAVLRVSAIRWGAVLPVPGSGALTLSAAPGDPGQTCVTLHGAHRAAPLIRRCTYGIVWMASVQTLADGPGLALAVQPLESWRELWLFHQRAGAWAVDVISPATDDPEAGYVEFAGFAPGAKRLLIVREVKEHGRFQRRFEELRLEDLALVRQASTPDLLRDFGRWQDVAWRRDTLALH